MKKEIIKWICGAIMCVGFFIIVGTAGAGDLNNIPMEQIITQSLIGLILFVGGSVGYQLVKEWEWRNES